MNTPEMCNLDPYINCKAVGNYAATHVSKGDELRVTLSWLNFYLKKGVVSIRQFLIQPLTESPTVSNTEAHPEVKVTSEYKYAPLGPVEGEMTLPYSEAAKILVVIDEDIPPVAWGDRPDGVHFHQGDIAYVPVSFAKIFIKRGWAHQMRQEVA